MMYLEIKLHQVQPLSCYAPTEFLQVFPICEVLVIGVNDDFMGRSC